MSPEEILRVPIDVGATCAGAGIIIGVVAITGLGLQFSSIALELAGGSLFVTPLYTAFVPWVIGLVVSVTGTYIIAVAITSSAIFSPFVPILTLYAIILPSVASGK
jgi:TRAP-type uncharacterized transport system fused permease subunit